MTCPRRHGFMVQDDSFDLYESEHRFAVWRCVPCGEIVDPIIAANRKPHLSRMESLAHAGGYGTPWPSLARGA